MSLLYMDSHHSTLRSMIILLQLVSLNTHGLGKTSRITCTLRPLTRPSAPLSQTLSPKCLYQQVMIQAEVKVRIKVSSLNCAQAAITAFPRAGTALRLPVLDITITMSLCKRSFMIRTYTVSRPRGIRMAAFTHVSHVGQAYDWISTKYRSCHAVTVFVGSSSVLTSPTYANFPISDIAVSYIPAESKRRVVWVNATKLVSEDPLDLASSPISPFPYARLAVITPSNGKVFYLYHQINASILAEDIYDPYIRSWTSNNISIPTE